MAIDDIREVLRALADVRDANFYLLWVDLIRSWPDPLPEIEFRIHRIADAADAMAVVGVEGTRPDGTEFSWGVTVSTRSDYLVVEGWIGTRSPDGVASEMFRRSEETHDPGRAADLIRALAAEVCEQRR